MKLRERFRSFLIKHSVTLLTGSESRCYMSISCLTQGEGRRRVVSINPYIDPDSPEGLEAFVVMLGFLETNSDPIGRLRFTAVMRDERISSRDLTRAWRMGARIAISERSMIAAHSMGLDDEELAEMAGVTVRLVEWRVYDQQTRAQLFCLPRPAIKMGYERPEPVWCEM